MLGAALAPGAFADLIRQASLGVTFSSENGKVVLRQVAADGNAARAGLQNGDVVVAADQKNAEPTPAFVRPLLRRAAGSKVAFTLLRAGEQKTVTVAYDARPMEKAEDIEIVYGSIPVDGYERRTLLTLPRDRKKHPAILFLAGSGCASQESPDGSDAVAQILYALTRRGYVTMRVEKTGVGDSTGPACYSEQGNLDQEVAGYRAGFQALAAHASVNPRKVFVFGHSAGSTLAPLVSKGLPVAGVIVAGAMGTNFLEYILAMRERERHLEGLPDEDVAKAMEITRGCLTRLLVEGQPADRIERENPACKKQVRFDSPPSYIAQWMKLDLSAAWEPVTAPVLVLFGSGDFVTSEEESQALVTRINAASGRQQARLATLPMDHGFLAHPTPDRAWKAEQGVVPPAGLLSRVVDSIESFLIEVQSR